jgi:enoyl-CoA hydratase/carnithine racemase
MDDDLSNFAVVVISLVCGFALGAALCDRIAVELRQIEEVVQWSL